MAIVGRILAELGFFLSLVLLNEALRRSVRKRSPDSQFVPALLISSLVLGWYSVSITLVLFNKWIVSSWGDGGLKFPIFYSMTHMLFKGIFSFSYQRCIRCRRLPSASRRVLLGTSLVGVMTGLDVATSNQSFLYISVSFFTMLKSASLIFLMALGVATGLEPCSLKIFGAVFVIAGGILLASYGEARFDVRGFVLVLSSELFAAVRWIVMQMVLQRSSLGTMVTVFYMAPASTLSLLPLVAGLERQEIASLLDPAAAAQYFGVVMFPGFMAFVLLLIEVELVRVTSSLTLSVFGNLKSIVTILFAILVFGEKASLLQWCGLLAALSGMFAYSVIKKKAMEVNALASLRYEALTSDEEEDATSGNGCKADTLSPVAAPASASPAAESSFGGGCSPDGASPGSRALHAMEGGRQEAGTTCAPQVLGLPSELRAAGARAEAPAAPAAEPRPEGGGHALPGTEAEDREDAAGRATAEAPGPEAVPPPPPAPVAPRPRARRPRGQPPAAAAEAAGPGVGGGAEGSEEAGGGRSSSLAPSSLSGPGPPEGSAGATEDWEGALAAAESAEAADEADEAHAYRGAEEVGATTEAAEAEEVEIEMAEAALEPAEAEGVRAVEAVAAEEPAEAQAVEAVEPVEAEGVRAVEAVAAEEPAEAQAKEADHL